MKEVSNFNRRDPPKRDQVQTGGASRGRNSKVNKSYSMLGHHKPFNLAKVEPNNDSLEIVLPQLM